MSEFRRRLLYLVENEQLEYKGLKFLSIGDTAVAIVNEGDNSPDIKYSLNGGKKWVRWDYSPINLQDGDSIYFKGDNPSGFSVSSSEYSNFSLSGDGMIAASGDITSLLDDGACNTLIIPIEYCFFGLFDGCTSLTTAPELPATTLAHGCYNSMFFNCSSLTAAPELPATTLDDSCYGYMFQGCTSLTTSPSLPATTLANNCYRGMFQGCTSLTTTPELLATTLANSCYRQMFQGCTSLTTAPELSATTLADGCYSWMFFGCTSLSEAPRLPATALTNSCYLFMFSDCTSLTEAPELPATTLANSCYSYMFSNCTSLTTAPELPATTLTAQCYFRMFAGCSNLVTAPELPAETLAGACYVMMFMNCKKLKYIKCLTLNPQRKSMTNWVADVAPVGTFIKHPNATSWPTGTIGIPKGWVIRDNGVFDYITFTSQQDNSNIGLNYISSHQQLLYSTDSGVTWNEFDTNTIIPLDSGESVYVCGKLTGNNSTSDCTNFNVTGGVSVSGNLSALWNYENPLQPLYEFCGCGLFGGCTGLVDAIGLTLGTSATNLARGCYYWMFQGCSGLATAPELPATTLTAQCYFRMFAECSNLVVAPELPAETLVGACYTMMFMNCRRLNYIKCLAIEGINQSTSTSSWVSGVASQGTFVKNASASWPTGINGIPNAWTVEDDVGPVVDNCSVVVESYINGKIAFIKTIREITGWGITEAKNFVESVPNVLMDNLSLEEARNIAQQVYDGSGNCVIKDSNGTIIETYYH